MSVVIPNEGKIEWAKRSMYGNAASENLVLKLGKTNITPANSDTSATYTVADFTGYSNVTLTSSQSGGTWSVPTITSNVASSTYGTTATWTATTDQTIYMWWIEGASSGKVYAAENIGAHPLVGANSDVISIIPKIKFSTI